MASSVTSCLRCSISACWAVCCAICWNDGCFFFGAVFAEAAGGHLHSLPIDRDARVLVDGAGDLAGAFRAARGYN